MATPLPSTLFTAYGTAIGVGLADLLTLLGPDRVVLGGGGARFFDLYRAAVEQALSHVVDCFPPTPVVAATLGDLAGAIGAALLAAHRTDHRTVS